MNVYNIETFNLGVLSSYWMIRCICKKKNRRTIKFEGYFNLQERLVYKFVNTLTVVSFIVQLGVCVSYTLSVLS